METLCLLYSLWGHLHPTHGAALPHPWENLLPTVGIGQDKRTGSNDGPRLR